MLRLILCVVALLPAVAHAAECKDIQARYKAKLDAARYESASFRKVTLGYLRSLESTFASCFKGGDGARLTAARVKLEKDKPPPRRRPADARDAVAQPPPQRRIDLSSGADSSTLSSYRRTNVGPASAALLSLAIPGGGQAVNNNGAAAWLFFLGTTGCYATTGILVGTAFDTKKSKWNEGQLTGALVVGIVGGIIHVSGIIHAAVTARR